MQPQDLYLLSPAVPTGMQAHTSYFETATSSQLEEATFGRDSMNEWEQREYLRTVEAYNTLTPLNQENRLDAEPTTPSNTFNPMDHTRLSPSNFDPAQL